jgi:hypothetical protein
MSDLNVGNLDRLLRIVVGVALVGLAAAGSIGALGRVGTALVLTGLSAGCPLCAPFRVAYDMSLGRPRHSATLPPQSPGKGDSRPNWREAGKPRCESSLEAGEERGARCEQQRSESADRQQPSHGNLDIGHERPKAKLTDCGVLCLHGSLLGVMQAR